MRRFLFFFLISISAYLAAEVKTTQIPAQVQIENGKVTETVIRDLSDEKIFKCYRMAVIGDYIFILNNDTSEINKFSFEGKKISVFGKMGEGPGSFIGLCGICGWGENIVVLDAYKIAIFDKNQKLLKEKKLNDRFMGIFSINADELYIFTNGTTDNYYFTIYNHDLQFARKFASKKSSFKERVKKLNFDIVKMVLYIPEKNGLWITYRNRYDLDFYKNERLVSIIKPHESVFIGREEDYPGRTVVMYDGYPVLLANEKNRLFYFYCKDKTLLCDLFDLLKENQFYKRLKMPVKYPILVHDKGNSFLGLRYTEDNENVLLTGITIENI